ncbi:MAG: peptidylprolyl isomerase [Firmicutes bacterium]|nr:peptidylprolyl isomerase [Bacillota bacterium]
MKKKTKYSLTAKQRKEQRADQAKKDAKKDVQTIPLTPEEIDAAIEKQAAELAAKKQRKSFVLRIVAVVVATVIAVNMIAWGVVFGVRGCDVDPTKSNPVATITLANKEKIVIELLYNESCTAGEEGNSKDGRAPIANFIYLAENKFFDNTIFTNSMKGFLAFEGYTAERDEENGGFKHKGQDIDYVASLPKTSFSGNQGGGVRSNKWNDTGYKLGYRLKNQTALTVREDDKRGYLAMLTDSGTGYRRDGVSFTRGTSTGFIMIHNSSANLVMGGAISTTTGGTTRNAFTYIGKMNEASIAVLEKIANMSTLPNDWLGDWAYPRDYREVMIETVRVSNLNRKLRANIIDNFEDFVLWLYPETTDPMNGFRAMKGYRTWSAMPNGYWHKTKE